MEFVEINWFPGDHRGPPEWRWLWAKYLACRDRRPHPERDDEWVRLAYAAITGGDGGPRVDAVRTAGVVWKEGPCRRRDELHARLLTDEPFDRLGARWAIPADVVEAYAEVFFDVRRNERPNLWVMLQAVGYCRMSGFSGPQPCASWKYAAYTGGEAALDIMIAVTTGEPLPADVAASLVRAGHDEDLFRRQVLLTHRLETAITPDEVAAVWEDRQRLRPLEAERTWRTPDLDPRQDLMEASMTALFRPRKSAERRSGMGGGRRPRGTISSRAGLRRYVAALNALAEF
jgi:hypothetical protein